MNVLFAKYDSNNICLEMDVGKNVSCMCDLASVYKTYSESFQSSYIVKQTEI